MWLLLVGVERLRNLMNQGDAEDRDLQNCLREAEQVAGADPKSMTVGIH